MDQELIKLNKIKKSKDALCRKTSTHLYLQDKNLTKIVSKRACNLRLKTFHFFLANYPKLQELGGPLFVQQSHYGD